MHYKVRRAVVLGAALAAAVAGAGCGSDDEPSSTGDAAATPSSSTRSAAKAPAGDPIVIGNIGGYTGQLAKTLGKGGDVLQAWVDDKNRSGGLNGHPIKVIIKDDASNPATALKAAKELVEQDKVVAIVSSFSFQEAAWEKYVAGKGIPVIGGASTNPAFQSDPDFFPSGTTLVPSLFGMLQQVKAAGKKKLGVMYCAETPVCAQLLPLLQGLGKVAGVEVTGQKVASNAPNYTAPCLALKGDGVDALWVAVTSDVVARVTKACNQQGFKPANVAVGSTVDSSFLTNPDLDGLIFAGANALYSSDNLPGVQEFNKLIDEYLPEVRDSDQFSLPLIFATAGADLFAAAAEKAKLTPTSTSADLIKGLYALKDVTVGGVSPPLNFVKGQPGGTLCYFQQRIQDGKFVADNGGKPTCPDAATAKALGAALAAG